MATRDQIKTILDLLSTLPNCPITSKETAELVMRQYTTILADVPNEYLQASYMQYVSRDNPFFPSNPGTLREIAFDLEMIAQGVPTAAQAWAMVLKGPSRVDARLCKTGFDLKQSCETPDVDKYWDSVWNYKKHLETCDSCSPTSRDGSYGSKVVDEVVRLMGGRDVIFTDNATADRARFLQSYNELVTRERDAMQMVPQVRAFVESDNRPMLVSKGVNQVAARLSAGGQR